MEAAQTQKKTPRIAASQSFGEDEIDLMEFTFETLLKSGNPQAAVRSKAFARVLRKIKTMRKRVNTVKASRETAAPVAAE